MFFQDVRTTFSSFFRIFGGIFLKVQAFLGLSDHNPFSISDKEASLKKNGLLFATLLCINKMLVWFLNLSIALLTGCIMSVLLSSVIYCNFHLLHDLLLHLYVYFVSYYFVIRYYVFIFIYKRNLIHNFFRVSEKKG